MVIAPELSKFKDQFIKVTNKVYFLKYPYLHLETHDGKEINLTLETRRVEFSNEHFEYGNPDNDCYVFILALESIKDSDNYDKDTQPELFVRGQNQRFVRMVCISEDGEEFGPVQSKSI